MNMPIEQLMERLASITEYRLLFASTFPERGMNPTTLAEAIATYERTVVSERSPFDAWIEGDERAIPEAAKRGFAIFNSKGQCSLCHEGWNFTNDSFHDTGLRSTDSGRAALLPNIPKMMHAFKTRGSARSNAGARICTMDRSRPLKRWSNIMTAAARTGQAGPT